MPNQYDRHFVQRYLHGKYSEQEKEEFLKWLNNADIPDQDAWMHDAWQETGMHEEDPTEAETRILQKVLAKIGHPPDPNAKPKALPLHNAGHVIQKSRWYFLPVVRYAAIILLVLLPLFVFEYYDKTKEVPVSATQPVNNKFTKDGQRLTFMLEDGTKVILNANSALEFPASFDDSVRKVVLHGEAFFNVAKDPERPFTVIAGNISTTAIGTAFNIRNDTVENKTNVSLTHGKVLVHNLGKGENIFNVYLEPGEELAYDAQNKTYSKEPFDYREKIAWKDGILYFGGDNIDTIVRKLQQWYGVTIELKNRPRKDWYFEGSFKNQSLENVLTGIAYSKDFRFSIKGKKVVITF